MRNFPIKLKNFARFYLVLRLYGYSDNTGIVIKEIVSMASIFKWFANASNNWDHTGNNDAADVLNLIGGIFGALGL